MGNISPFLFFLTGLAVWQSQSENEWDLFPSFFFFFFFPCREKSLLSLPCLVGPLCVESSAVGFQGVVERRRFLWFETVGYFINLQWR